MSRIRQAVVASVIVAIVVSAGFAGYVNGLRVQHRVSSLQHAYETERDRLILARIVKVNRDAPVRDFDSSFPEMLVQASESRGIDFRLAMAMIEKESAWNPRAVGKAGEVGLMQMLPDTALLVAKSLNDTTFKRPVPSRAGGYADLGSLGEARTSVVYGMEYLRMQVASFGMNATAIRAYNRNPANAREDRPWDRYAEDVGLRFVLLAHLVPAR